jgi:hypothetical protein
MQFIAPGSHDALAAAIGVRSCLPARTATLPGGAQLQARFRSDPQLRLSDSLTLWKTRLAQTAWATEVPHFTEAPDAPSAALPFDLDQALDAARRATAMPFAVTGAPGTALKAQLAANLLGQPRASAILCEEMAIRDW